jgi:hypothetical protein
MTERGAFAAMVRRQDFWAGLLFILCGAVGLYLAKDLTFGTSTRMGAGYLPRVLSWGVLGLGIIVLVRGYFAGNKVEIDFRYRPVILVLGSIAVFGLMIERAGLAFTVFVATIVASAGLRDVRWIEGVIFAAVLAAFSVLVFVMGLKLPIPMWPR